VAKEAAKVSGDTHVGQLEFRVGKILEAWPHPESDKLYCEKIGAFFLLCL